MIDIVVEGKSFTTIKTRADAAKFLDEIIDKDIIVRLWDEMDDNRLIRVDSDPEYDSYCNVEYIDSVNDGVWHDSEYRSEVVDMLYKYRSHINKFMRDEY